MTKISIFILLTNRNSEDNRLSWLGSVPTIHLTLMTEIHVLTVKRENISILKHGLVINVQKTKPMLRKLRAVKNCSMSVSLLQWPKRTWKGTQIIHWKIIKKIRQISRLKILTNSVLTALLMEPSMDVDYVSNQLHISILREAFVQRRKSS